MNIDEGVKVCKESGYTGWDLVEYVQKFVSENMKYSCDNPMQFPKKAFKNGQGYCWQQASCVNYSLRKMGIKSELVFVTKGKFPEKIYQGKKIKEYTSGHVWCKVTIDNAVKDVCTCNQDNIPGKVHFTLLTKERKYDMFACIGGYLGSIFSCYKIRKKLQENKDDYSI